MSEKNWPTELDLLAWYIYQENGWSFDKLSPKWIKQTIEKFRTIPNRKVHADLYIAYEDFRKEFCDIKE